jgi:RNA-directed DNA polymerase
VEASAAQRGTPQGGVHQPAARQHLHAPLPPGVAERGKGQEYEARIVNYADDFVILSRGRARAALEWTRWAMGHLGLSLNETKTCLRDAREDGFDFLGYTFGVERYRKDGHTYLAAKPSKKSVQRLKQRVRAVLRPGNQGAWPEVRDQLNRILRGWANYFDYGTRLMAYRAADNYVYERARHFLTRRHKVTWARYPAVLGQSVFDELGVQRLRPLHVGPTA